MEEARGGHQERSRIAHVLCRKIKRERLKDVINRQEANLENDIGRTGKRRGRATYKRSLEERPGEPFEAALDNP